MFDSNQFFSGGAAGFYPLTIDQSLRFYNNAYLTNTMSSASGTYTVSVWLKRAIITSSGYQYIWSSGAAGLAIGSTAGSVDQFYVYDGSTVQYATPKYRDPSAWYHLVLSVSSNTGVLYVNGESVKTGISCASLSTSANASRIGTYGGGAALPLDGYLAEFHFTDGTAYDADVFGEFKSGVWVAKAPSVTYGTNGFYLDFANSADIGNDISGNNNDWTPNNFTASDVVLDSPTDNFATWNPLVLSAVTFSDGNLIATMSASTPSKIVSTIGVSSGKYYMEYTHKGNNSWPVGISADNASRDYLGMPDGNTSISFWCGTSSTDVYINGVLQSFSGSGTAWTNGDIVGIALNADDEEVSLYKNGVLVGSAMSYASYNWDQAFFAAGNYVSGFVFEANFGQSGFTYTPPTDYLALSTANLPEPTISPADDASPEDYFSPLLYSGDGTSSQEVNGLTFQPDFVWIKNRSASTAHALQDAVRGASGGKYWYLRSDAPDADFVQTDGDGLLSLDSDGFTVGYANGTAWNASGNSYVAWNWKAGGAPTTDNIGGQTPTSGSVYIDGVVSTDSFPSSNIYPTRLSANTETGFSIITYEGNGGTNQSMPHGLNQAPELYIAKSRDGVRFWGVITTVGVNPVGYLKLEQTDSEVASSATAPTADHVYANGTVINSAESYVMYCFHSVEGFSKFGSYVGNGSATGDGTFVYTGFRPAFVVIKASSTTGNWQIIDDKRLGYNIDNKLLFPNLSADESTSGVTADMLSNGFKLRSTATSLNGSNVTLIYAAFAENPFKYSNAR